MSIATYLRRSLRWSWLLLLVACCGKLMAQDATDDLQAYLDRLASSVTRAATSDTIVVDLSTFSATARNSTLTVQSLCYRFENGTLKRGANLPASSPIVAIINGADVIMDESVTISGENLTNNGTAVYVENSKLTTSANIINMKVGSTTGAMLAVMAGAASKIIVEGGEVYGLSMPLTDTEVRINGGNVTGPIYTSSDVYLNSNRTCKATVKQFSPNADSNAKIILGAGGLKQKLYYYLQYETSNITDGRTLILGDGCTEGATSQPGRAYKISKADLDSLVVRGAPYVSSGLSPKLESGRIVLRAPGLQDYIDALPDDNQEHVINTDDFGVITTPTTIPQYLKVTLEGTKKLVIGASFTGSFLFKTEKGATLTFNVPDIVWEEGAALPQIFFDAYGSDSEIKLNGVSGNQLAGANTLIHVENSATVYVGTDIGGDAIVVKNSGRFIMEKPQSNLDSYIKSLSVGDNASAAISGNVYFDELTSYGTFSWGCDGTIHLPEKIKLASNYSSMEFTVDGVSFANTQINSAQLIIIDPEDVFSSAVRDDFSDAIQSFSASDNGNNNRILMRFNGLANLATNGYQDLHWSDYEGASPRQTVEGNDYLLSLESVDSAAYTRLNERITAFTDSATVATYIISALNSRLTDQRDKMDETTFYAFVDSINSFDAALRDINATEYTTITEPLKVFYGTQSVAEYAELQTAQDERLAALLANLRHLSDFIEKEIALGGDKYASNEDDLQDYLDSLAAAAIAANDSTAVGSEARPAVVVLPDRPFEIHHLVIDRHYVVFRWRHNNGNGRLRLRPNGQEPALKVKPDAHLTLEQIVVEGEETPTAPQLIYVQGTLVINIDVHFVNVGGYDRVVYVPEGGRVEWNGGELPQGNVENHGNFVMKAGIIDVYYNHGHHEMHGGTAHRVHNYSMYQLYDGVVGATDSTSTAPAIENHGEMHLKGGRVTGYGPVLIIHYQYSVIYIDGVEIDDRHVTHTIEAHGDVYTRGDVPYRHVVIDNGVKFYIITQWTVVWHITFVDDRLPVRQVIFTSPEGFIPTDFRRLIDFTLPKGYRWHYDAAVHSVEARDEKVHDEDDLQAFLDSLANDPGTEEEPRLLDGEGYTVPWVDFPAATGNRHLHVEHITFKLPEPTHVPALWTVADGSSARFTGVTFEGDSRREGGPTEEQWHIVVRGTVVIEEVHLHHCHLAAYTPLYLNEALSDTLFVRLLPTTGELQSGALAVLPTTTYQPTAADAAWVVYPGSEVWGYRLGEQGIELCPKEMSALDDVRATHARLYVDGSGRVHAEGISDSTECRIISADGRVRYAGTVAGTEQLSLERGCYLLQVGGTTTKVVR
jgi:hypothetical protein